MDPLNPWLDPSEVRHLAEQLLRPVSAARLSAADPGFSSEFVGFILPTHNNLQTAPPIMEAEEYRTISAGDIPFPCPDEDQPVVNCISQLASWHPNADRPATDVTSEDASQDVAPEPPPSPQARIRERTAIFSNWLAHTFRASEIFILDPNGEILFDQSSHGRLHFMARNLNLPSHTSEAQPGNIHIKIGPGAVCEVIPCHTSSGRFILGALLPDALPRANVHTIAELLIQTLSPG